MSQASTLTAAPLKGIAAMIAGAAIVIESNIYMIRREAQRR